MAVFVATVAPEGWDLGRWEQKSEESWEETKLTPEGEKHSFDVIGGPTTPGSRLLRLRMHGNDTEAMVLDSSALIFVDGNFLGEVIGYWESPYMPPGALPPPRPPALPGREAPDGDDAGGAQKAPPPMPPRPGAWSQDAPMQQKATLPLLGTPMSQQGFLQPGATPMSQHGFFQPGATPMSKMGSPMMGSSGRFGGSDFGMAPPAQPVMPHPRPPKPDDLDASPAMVQKLQTAAKAGEADVVTRLLASRADPDCSGPDGKTALYTAAAANKLAVVEVLLNAGADANLGKDGNTPMTIAFQKGNKKVLQALFASTFQNLEREVGPGVGPTPLGTKGRRRQNGQYEDSAPDTAWGELVEATGRLVNVGKSRKNHRFAPIEQSGDDLSADKADMAAEAGVKDAMKSLLRAQK